MAERRAILIGVDGYAFRPLASAVNDVVAMRTALISDMFGLGAIFAESDITVLATPAKEVAPPLPNIFLATHDNILGALRPHYDSDDPAAFLLVYFAGHGLSASPDSRVRESLILPSDVTAPGEGRNMVSVTALLALFAERGPTQQLWIVDACRDMPYEKRPRGYEIDWPDQPPQTPRSQVAIFAVAPGGTALSETGGQGRFTGHLLDGLAGKGSAADYVPGRGYCVTPQSLHEYARRRVAHALDGFDDWTTAVQTPQLTQAGPPSDPIRDLPDPDPCDFTVTVRPPEAAAAVKIALEVQLGMPVGGWPPAAPPRVYEMRATLLPGMDREGWLPPRPRLAAIDLREETSAVIEVPRRSVLESASAPTLQPTTGERGIARAQTVAQTAAPPSFVFAPGAPKEAKLTVRAADTVARVRLQRTEPPWNERVEAANSELKVDPGIWDVMVTLGDEIIGATRVILKNGERRTVESVIQVTPAAAALLQRAPWYFTSLDVTSDIASASALNVPAIGPMQGAILPTLLPLLALATRDTRTTLAEPFGFLAIPTITDEGDAGPFAVAIAFEGPRPPERTPSVRDATAMWTGADGRIVLFSGQQRGARGTVTMDLGTRRINIAAPCLRRGVTAVTATVWPDGRIDVSVGIFALPLGRKWTDEPTVRPALSVGQIARALALATPLFRAGVDLESTPDPVLTDLAHAKCTDPVLGVLAFHALDQRRANTRENASDGVRFSEAIQRNLARDFAELPDSRIIAALVPEADARQSALIRLLDEPEFPQPVLAASLAHLAAAATTARRFDHWAVDRFDRLAPGSVFNAVRLTSEESANAQPQ